MNYITIKKKDNKFSVSAITLGSNGTKKIPHPFGNDTIEFNTIEEAEQAIKLAGFEYVLPNGEISARELPENIADYDKKIIEALLKETKDINPNIVATAINALSEINSTDCLNIYISKIGEDNEKIRQNSIDAIVKFGLEALPSIFNSLKSENWVKRNSSIICLQKFCEFKNAPIENIIETLLKMLDDKNPVVKCSVIETLGIAYKAFKNQN